ncbi:MAG: LacI family transcriptional regulator [Clostridiales bacterium]|nr:LacI family transcriptional regulator [Clostridiales bacterium]
MATLKDIAKIAGVNVSTVSKALRGSSDINKQTMKNIRKIADELDYKYVIQDNRKDKAKQQDSLNTIGIICPEITSSYYSEIVNMITKEMRKKGYYCIIGFTDFDSKNEGQYLEGLLKSNVKGIIFITESLEIGDTISLLKNGDNFIPLVVIAQNSGTKEHDCIRIDDKYGIKLSIDHLLELGHTDIGYIGDELSNARLEAFIEILQANNIKMNRKWIRVSEERFEKCGYDLMTDMLKEDNLPTAILSAYDNIAVGAIKAITDSGRNVPEDISMIGIDNISVTAYYNPEITSVAGPAEEMARIAVKLLFKKIESPEYKVIQNVVLPPTLVVRKSVKSLK